MPIWMCPKCHRNWNIDPKEKTYCVCGERYLPDMPTFPQRLWNFSFALYKHWIEGMPSCTDDEVQERLNKCKQCNFFTGSHCSHIACGCNINGEVKFLNKLAWADQKCPIDVWGPIRPKWVTTAQLSLDILTLIEKIDSDIVAIIGVARSGLVVGSQVASYLHLPLYSLDIFTKEFVRCGSGFRMQNYEEREGYYLIVDDTINSYQTLKAATELIEKPHKTAVIYAAPTHVDKVDYYVKQLALPHYLEWSFFNSHYTEIASYDLDGIICEECASLEIFLEKIDTLAPKYLPRNKPIKIVTARPEYLRERTLAYLTKYHVVVEKLIMAQTKEDYMYPADFKAKNITTKIFVESSIDQAKRIKELRPEITVICPTVGEVL